MAKRDSTLKARPRHMRARKAREGQGEDAPQQARTEACRGAIETERTRLMRAEAVLGAVAFALLYAEWRREMGADYANAIQAAREIVQETISRLDSVTLGLLDRP